VSARPVESGPVPSGAGPADVGMTAPAGRSSGWLEPSDRLALAPACRPVAHRCARCRCWACRPFVDRRCCGRVRRRFAGRRCGSCRPFAGRRRGGGRRWCAGRCCGRRSCGRRCCGRRCCGRQCWWDVRHPFAGRRCWACGQFAGRRRGSGRRRSARRWWGRGRPFADRRCGGVRRRFAGRRSFGGGRRWRGDDPDAGCRRMLAGPDGQHPPLRPEGHPSGDDQTRPMSEDWRASAAAHDARHSRRGAVALGAEVWP
jgi:hypothetical protein